MTCNSVSEVQTLDYPASRANAPKATSHFLLKPAIKSVVVLDKTVAQLLIHVNC